MRMLLTGGTGLLGQALLPKLRLWAKSVDVLSRTAAGEVDRVKCDLSRWDAGIPTERLRALTGRYDFMVHLAALYDPRSSWADAYQNTVQATHTALTLAAKLGIPNFLHVSTVGIALGDDFGAIGAGYPTDRLSVDHPFPDSYSYSKAHAEAMVRRWMSGVPNRTVCRLGIIVGDTQGNPPPRIDGAYFAAQGLDRIQDLLRAVPGPLPLVGREQARLPLVPLDVVSRALDQIIQVRAKVPVRGVSCFHLTPRRGLPIRELYRFVLDRLGMTDRQFFFMNNLPEGLQKRFVDFALGLPKEELEYSLHLPQFDSSATCALLGEEWCPEFEQYQDAFWKGYRSYAENRSA
jgi:nucleoside-diphosphate-sugar epimerase